MHAHNTYTLMYIESLVFLVTHLLFLGSISIWAIALAFNNLVVKLSVHMQI